MEHKCLWCGSKYVEFKLTPQLTHYGRVDCPLCKKFSHWVKNPNKANVRTSTSKLSITKILEFHNIKDEVCFFCLRKRDQLGVCETLTIDHIIELDKGGLDEIGNLQILCTACHKLKNWMRLYNNWHVNNEELTEE